ncbi:MAG: hypothetical protein KatS3mg015_2815 [Fimbriimonadales bacterium]|nr:MAG: hypothetical protein KatS3mg015_2815 [Fimbriimonadales bacterium]
MATNTALPANPFGGSPGPHYNQLESLYRAQGAAEAAAMRSAIQQMLIGMGLVPQGFKDKFGALDKTTKALVEKNTATGISTYARLLEQKRQNIKNLINRLNARGLRRSGARGYGLRKIQLDADRSLSDVVSRLLGDIGGMYSQYTGNEYARQAALIQAAMNSSAGSWGSTWNNPASTTTTTSSGSFPLGTKFVGSSFDNPEGTLYHFGGNWWGY